MRHVTGPALDRLDHSRHEGSPYTPETLVLTLDAGAASVLVEGRSNPCLALVPLAALDEEPATLVLLGEREGTRWAARALSPEQAGSAIPDARFETIRAAASSLPKDEAGLVVYAAGVLGWHRRSRFCGECGDETRSTFGGHQRVCSGCGASQFPRTDPAVITLVRRGGRCLLINQPSWPEDRFAAVAGFVEPGESLEQAVAREVAEEVGLELTSVTYLASQPWPFPHSLMIAFRSEAAAGKLRLNGEVRSARWFTRDELRAAVDSGEITIPTPFSVSRTLIDDWLAASPA